MSNLAKNFEKIFKEQASELDGVYVMRLPDQISFYKGSTNPCDFVAYKRPHGFCIELKTTAGSSMPLKNIADTQLEGMYEAIQTRGIKAYVVIWFYEHDVTVAFPIKYIWRMVNKQGKKSVRYDDDNGIVIPAEKIKKYFKYDWSVLFR